MGGMCACRCSGSTALKYGSMRENVLNVTAVLADGTILKTGTRARKSSAGYDLTRLLIGSEGTISLCDTTTIRTGLVCSVRAFLCHSVKIHAIIRLIHIVCVHAIFCLLPDRHIGDHY